MPRIRVLPTKRRAEGDAKVVQQLEVTPLGAGREVGRSCILLKYAGKTVLVREAGGSVNLLDRQMFHCSWIAG